jgi:hypothetical protein
MGETAALRNETDLLQPGEKVGQLNVRIKLYAS